ncbi:hypothetical protein ACVQ8P_07700 [Dellaglioa sp. BT-FLS60]
MTNQPNPGLTFLLENNRDALVFGVLKKMALNQNHPSYDDFVQEGRLAFSAAYDQYPKCIEDNEQTFMVYAYQRVYWRLLDLINRQSNQQTHLEPNGDDSTNPTDAIIDLTLQTQDTIAEKLFTEHLFKALYDLCSTVEQHYLVDCYIRHQTVAEIATSHHVSRQTAYNWRNNVGKKALLVIAQMNRE